MLCACLLPACRGSSSPEEALPPVSGSLSVTGLISAVRVVRDRWGIPHIYAANQHDLFFAQGFVQAQDRLFQMDLWRRSSQGRLSEVLGANFIERDAMTRRMQYHGDAEAEWASYGPDARAIADAFVQGINAWVDAVGGRLPEEFPLAGWRPEHWKADDLLNRTDAFLASANASDEVFRARLVAAVGRRPADGLTRHAFALPIDVPRGLPIEAISYVVSDALREVGTPPFFSGLAATPKAATLAASPADPKDPERGIAGQSGSRGSNAWAIVGAHSASGAPLLAADPHRALAHPSLRYLVHLNAPGWNVIGAASPWLPGVINGHNDQLAWATTSRAADVQDLYVEKVNPANPRQVEHAGRWVDMKVLADPIVVKGKSKPFPFERESTSHGVVVASDRARHLVFTVRWIGFEPGTAAELAALQIDRAESEDDLLEALDRWKLPSATIVYATREGRIGTEAAGWVPVRAAWNGTLPVPGWTGGYEWTGFRRERAASGTRDRERGYVAAANGSVARERRIEQRLSAPAPLGTADFEQLQHDTLAWNAEQLVPLLAGIRSDRPDVEDARNRLLAWDRRLSADSTAAPLYVLWERSLLRRLAAQKIPASMAEDFAARAKAVLVPAITAPTSLWFSGRPAASRDELLRTALADAVDASAGGRSAPGQTWGSLHTALFHHPLAVTAAARRRFDVGPFDRAGYGDTVMATGGVDLEQASGATFSLIADLGVWDRSLVTNAPGQSGAAASAHFADLAKVWSMNQYVPLAFGAAEVQKHAEATLVLAPP